MKKNIYNAFSLMEMMVVLLIVAIVAAATAPMVTKKMSRNAGSGDSPWVFTGLGGNIAYNMGGNDNTTVMIGTSSLPNGWGGITRLFIDSGNNASHIAFGNGNQTPLLLTADPAGRVGFSNANIPSNSVAFGAEQTIANTSRDTIAIGQGANVSSNRNIAIGYQSLVNDTYAIAIGSRMNRDGNDEMDKTQATNHGSIAIGTGARSLGSYSIAIGTSNFRNNAYQSPLADAERAIAIGAGTQAFGVGAVSIGNGTGLSTSPKTQAYGNSSVAIGSGAVTGTNSDNTVSKNIAIGFRAKATKKCSIAIGGYDDLNGSGKGTEATHIHSTAIGSGAQTTADNQIVLGTSRDTVYIPGNLVVEKNTLLGGTTGMYRTFIRHKTNGRNNWNTKSIEVNKGNNDDFRWGEDYSDSAFKGEYSDRRLKNVGEKYTAGLDELKKLEFYHYTFKKDEKKTPMVGVMAQDLQKVFPEAVTKGDDGYLRIRLEDMFYAVINAVKELDNKISEIVANISGINSKIESLEKENSELQKENSELKAEIKDIEKRIEKLESSKH